MQVRLNEYVSHKRVHAAEILSIERRLGDGSAQLMVKGPDGAAVEFATRAKFLARGEPLAGDMLVVYDADTPDEYHSWSPREKFRAGYTPLPPAA